MCIKFLTLIYELGIINSKLTVTSESTALNFSPKANNCVLEKLSLFSVILCLSILFNDIRKFMRNVMLSLIELPQISLKLVKAIVVVSHVVNF